MIHYLSIMFMLTDVVEPNLLTNILGYYFAGIITLTIMA